jgi:hypothetical protein
MSSDRHDFAVARAEFRNARRTGLAQPMRRAMPQPCFVAPLAEPVAKSVSRERLSELGDEIGVFP